MTNLTQSQHDTDALQELVDLLQPTVERREIKAGYVDLLGEEDLLGPHLGQRLFRSKLFPYVYEHLWRPFAGRAMFGMKWFRLAKERKMLLDMLEISPGSKVIDIGCGPGNCTRLLASGTGGGLVVGIDASPEMLAKAVKTGGGENLAYVRGDASALPFGDGVFDAACCVGVIHMVEDPMKALDEITRVLVPGGRLALQATCHKRKSAPPAPGGLRIFAHDELTAALADRGFLDVQQRFTGRGQFLSARKSTT